MTTQVLCPGVVATQFHASQDEAPGVPPMSAEDVVAASLSALGDEELICAPGLQDPAAVEALTTAEKAPLMSASGPVFAARHLS